MTKYKFYWRHNIKSDCEDITIEQLLEVVDESESRKDMKDKILELFNRDHYDKSFSECTIVQVLIDSSKKEIRQEKILAKGMALLNPNTKNFNRKIGIQVSFIDAIGCIEDKSVRKELWELYLKDHKIIKIE